MPVDTSFYPTRQPEPINPLSLVQGYASAAHTLGENKLLQQTIRGRQALGQIIQQNTDESGIVNPAAALRDISQNPDASWMYLQQQENFKNANPLTQYMGTNAQGQPTPAQAPLYKVPGVFTQPQLSQAQIDEIHAHNDAMINTLEPLANDPNVDHKKVIRAVSDLVARPEAKFNAMDGAAALGSIPFGANGEPPDSAAIQERLQPLLAKQKQNEQILSQKYPSSNQLAARERAAALARPLNLSSPGVATGLPAGYAGNQASRQTHYQQVLDEANSVPQENAVLNNILNVSKSGADTGTKIGEMYQVMARSGLVPQGIVDRAEMLQTIKAHISQMALAGGMPESDKRLAAIKSANVDDAQLPETMQAMIPFLKGVNNAKVARAKFYTSTDPTGADPQRITQAQTTWNSHTDPRVFELQELQSDPVALKKFTSGLSPQDRKSLLSKYQVARQLGILNQEQ